MSAIFKWMIVLLLLLTVAGGGGVYWCYIRSDELLRVELLKQLQVMAPDLKFAIERANFDFIGRVRIQGLAIQLPEETEPALYVPETVVTLDDQQMTDFDKVSVQRMRFVHPQLRVIRKRDGRWNWQGITWVRNNAQAVPELEIEHGMIIVDLQRDRRASRRLTMADLNVKGVPAAARKFTAVISTRIDPAGPLSATIDANLDGPPFQLEAKWMRLLVDDDLLDLIGEVSPSVNDKLIEARQAVANLAATQAASSSIAARPGSNPNANAAPISLQSQVPAISYPVPGPFGLKCNCDLHCRLKWTDGENPLQYQVLAEVRSGQFSNVVLPFPLYEIRGAVYVDPKQVVLRDVRAENGTTRLYLSTQVTPLASNKIPRLKLQIRNVAVDDALKSRLPEPARKFLNAFGAGGMVDLDLAAVQGDKLSWEGDLQLTEGTFNHEKFPYPIRDVTGTVRLRGQRIELSATGKASGVPVKVSGWLENPGAAHESEFIVTGDGIPINSVLSDACPVALRKALHELDLQGGGDCWVKFQKPAGVGNKYQIYTAVRLNECSCQLRSFPYRVEHLKGLVVWDDDLVTFKGLQGTHDETELSAAGQFRRSPAPGRLDLVIQANNGAFDRALELAVPPSIHKLWQEFQPSGLFDVKTVIGWVPGQPCQVEMPEISVKNAELTLRSFPWTLQRLTGEFAYTAPNVVIKSVSAQHDDTQLRGRGDVSFSPGEPWRLTFDELHVDDLIPNATFRKALPKQLRTVFDTLNPTGKFSISTTVWEGQASRFGSVTLVGADGDPDIASTWDIQLTLADSSVYAGILVHDIHGRIDMKGASDGVATTLTGKLDLDSISVFRQPTGMAHQIVRVVGPFSLENGVFVGGSQAMALPVPGQTPRANLPDRISGDFLDGKLTLDVRADLRGEPEYSLLTTMTRGRLESYAHQYLRGQSNLAGVMNGWMRLWGKGKSEDQIRGRGEVQIAPAALYELPIFVQIFQALRLDAVDRTAFDRADVAYTIDRSRFNFDAVHLTGSAIDLVGRGYVRFDGGMQFDFYSMLARNRVRIPVISEIANVISRGWVGVKVTGHIGAPETRMVPVPEIDDALKQLMGTGETQRRGATVPKPGDPLRR